MSAVDVAAVPGDVVVVAVAVAVPVADVDGKLMTQGCASTPKLIILAPNECQILKKSFLAARGSMTFLTTSRHR